MRACLRTLDGGTQWHTYDFEEMPKVLKIPGVLPEPINESFVGFNEMKFYTRQFDLQYIHRPKGGRKPHALYKERFNDFFHEEESHVTPGL